MPALRMAIDDEGKPLTYDEFRAQPANRLGYGRFTGYELKIIQEIITLIVFVGFAWLVLGERLRWNYAVSLVFLGLAAFFAFGVNRPAPPVT